MLKLERGIILIISKDFLISLVLLLFCLINHFSLIPNQVIREGTSANYPYMVNAVLFVFVLIYLIISLKKRKDLNLNHINVSFLKKPYILKNACIFLLMILYIYFIDSLGFILVSFLFIMLSMILYGIRNYWKVFIISITFPIIVSYIFKILLQSILPGGIIEQIIFGW